jgi:tripartite-type tricarboxylate transporter receptor subunit TctC
MTITRRGFSKLVASAVPLATLPQSSWAQAYPARPITILVFVGAGGGPDIVSRLVAQGLSQRLGQPVIVENRPGGGGNLALQAVARAPADGYTLLLIATPHAVNVTLYEKLNVNVTHDIEPVASIDNDPFVMEVSPSLPVKTVAEFIAYVKANPGKVNVSSSGSGNLSDLAAALFEMMAGVKMVHVPYRGMPAALTALLTGEVHVTFDALPSSMPHIKDGKLRALAVTTAERLKDLPDIPTVAETVPGYAVTGWLGVGVPKGTPREIVERLHSEINAVLNDPPVAARFASIGSEPRPESTAAFSKLIADEVEKWGKVVKFAGLKAD